MTITASQRADRVRGIGASEVAALFNKHRFMNAADLLLIKRGDVVLPDEDEGFGPDGVDDVRTMGNFHEEGIAQMAARCLKAELVVPPDTYIHENGVLRANIDRQIGQAAKGAPVVEIKQTGITEGWGDRGTTIIPEEVEIQCAAQAACVGNTEIKVCREFVGFKSRHLFIYHLVVDDRMKRMMDAIASMTTIWWQRHVINRDPLPSTEPPPARELLKLVSREPKSVVDVPVEFYIEAAEARDLRLAAENDEEFKTSRLINALGQAECGVCEAGKFTYLAQKARRIDVTRLKAEAPDVAAAFTVESESRVGRFKAQK